jgi:threonylcarbamoyladenosine tRNA methylthiotransferase MtaB
MTTFAGFAFGCRVNQAEKQTFDRELLRANFTYQENRPDFYIINSCAVTAKAEKETRKLIHLVSRKWPKTKIILTGCAATKWKSFEGVELIPNSEKDQIASYLVRRLEGSDLVLRTRSDPLPVPGKYRASGRLLVKIQDGCNQFCSFCIVPYLRGQPKSRKIKDIIAEINSYPNIREVILTAINTQAFGQDTGESFIDLLQSVLNLTAAARISLGSLHPWSLDDKFLDFYQKVLPLNRLVNYFHVPTQSGSDKILIAMKRGYTIKEISNKLQKLYDINPLSLIGTDIIVGFPGETDTDFKQTYEFLKISPIVKFHTFKFSARVGTAAYLLSKKIGEPTPPEKQKRSKALEELGKHKYQSFLETHIGKSFQALFLEKRINGFQEALLSNQIPVLVKTPKDLTGKIKIVSISPTLSTTSSQNKVTLSSTQST